MSDQTETLYTASFNDALLQVTNRIVSEFRRSPQWENAVPHALGELGEAVQASHVFVFEILHTSEHEVVLRRSAEWSSQGGPVQEQRPGSVSISTCVLSTPLWQEQLTTGVLLDALGELPEELQTFLTAGGVRSLVVSPIEVGGDVWGYLGFDDAITERPWSAGELSALNLVANALGGAIEQQQIELERARIAAIFDNSEDAIISKTLDAIVTDWNGAAERIYGYTREEMIGTSLKRVTPPELHGELLEIKDALTSGRGIKHHETIRINKQGTKLAVSLSISPIYDPAGNLTGAVTIARDISEKKRAELALRASEERLRLALESGNIGAWDWDMETDQIVWSPNMEHLHGLETGAFDGTFEMFRQNIFPDDVDYVMETLQQSISGERDYQLEYRTRSTNGSPHWMQVAGSIVRDVSGEPVRMTGVCFDITERKQVQVTQAALLAQLQRAHAEADAESARLRELFHHAPSMMALLEGPDHVFELANDHFLRSVGYRDVLKRPVAEAVPELVEQGILTLLDQVYETGVTITRSELPIFVDLQNDGALDQRYFSFAYQPYQTPRGDITGVLIHAVDLTEHVRARQQVEKLAMETADERDRLQQLIDVLPEAIAITDERGQFELVNSAASGIWGQPPLVGDWRQYDSVECYFPDGERYTVEEMPLTRSLLHGEIVLGEQMSIRNTDSGELVPILINSTPLKDRDGNIIGAVAVFQDITSLKDFEQQKDDFLQTVSHDLKNPLTTIIGNIQLLQRSSAVASERVAATIRNMESAADRALVMLDEVLDVTRQQMGRPLELTLEPVDLAALVTRIVEQHQAMTGHHRIIVKTHEAELRGNWDRVRLERVIANLVSNAIQYSPDGGDVIITLDLERATGGDTVIMQVQDFGLGIPASEMSNLFERFWRASNVRDRFRGTGLGLTGAKAIVDAHGGEIVAESWESKGTTFTVRLPVGGS